jgi:O-antigen biosynthesis protein WbqP
MREKTMTRMDDFSYIDISGRQYVRWKRGLDILCAALALVILAIPIGLMALAVLLDDGGPVLFRQERVGRSGRSFYMYKLRTMKKSAPAQMPSHQRSGAEDYTTRVGRFLRKYSLDELPQLVNVLKGDMSLVGPRPLILQEREIHALREKFGVYAVRPGLTGLAQINGRESLGAREKVLWDVTYLRDFGLGTDLRILWGTIPQVLRGNEENNGGEKS